MAYNLKLRYKDEDGDVSQQWTVSIPNDKGLAKAMTRALEASDEIEEVTVTTLGEIEVDWSK